jgi:hypothetical protein
VAELRVLGARHAELDRNVRWLWSLLVELREYGTTVRAAEQSPKKSAREPLFPPKLGPGPRMDKEQITGVVKAWTYSPCRLIGSRRRRSRLF